MLRWLGLPWYHVTVVKAFKSPGQRSRGPESTAESTAESTLESTCGTTNESITESTVESTLESTKKEQS